MKVARRSETALEPLTQGQFSGSVTHQALARLDGADAAALVVNFANGARTGWHRHSAGQVLFVLGGNGCAGTREGETVSLAPGDLVYAPPGEEHWHGAREGASLSHLALSFGETEWLGLVEDDAAR